MSKTLASISADEALQRLVAGNERFLRCELHFPALVQETLKGLVEHQQPYATILGCSDSRVRWTVKQIVETPEGRARVAEGKMKIVGAVHEISTGGVRFLD